MIFAAMIVGATEAAQAAGTTGEIAQDDPHLQSHQRQRESVRLGAARRGDVKSAARDDDEHKSLQHTSQRDNTRRDATIHDEPCGCNSVVECQLPKLNVAGSNPVTRLDVN